MRFWIMNGLGNRFAVFDGRASGLQTLDDTDIQAAASHADADQVILLSAKSGADARMHVWNRDGSKVDACGNAARCAGWLLAGALNKSEILLAVGDRLQMARLEGERRVSVDMGRPGLDWRDIPLSEENSTVTLPLQAGPIDDPIVSRPGAVSMGNPHCVFFVEDVAAIDVAALGSLLEHHPLFPESANIGFAQILDPERIRLRVWERGAGLTLACGTGACAALVAAHRRKLAGRKATMLLDGGELEVEWRAEDDHVIQRGAVELEGEGSI